MKDTRYHPARLVFSNRDVFAYYTNTFLYYAGNTRMPPRVPTSGSEPCRGNKKMKLSRNKQRSFKVEDYVTIKIDKVDKTTPLHPNVILGKIINMENDYAKVVTTFGIISTYISTNRLNKCTRTNVLFDYTKEIPFSTASKQAINDH